MVDFISMFTGMSERDIGLLLKTIVQDTINSQLTNAEISETDNKTPVLITNAKDVELMNDISIQSAINIEPSTVYLMPEEPDGVDLKLWLKFQNAGELRDWSYQKNTSYSTGGNTMPGLFSKFNDNSMLKYELYSYFNGISHYAYTLDGPAVRILPNITSSKITSFFMRILPISLSRLLYADNNALFTKVDDDQLRYGYSVIMDANGSLHFYVRNDYRQYHLFIKDAYNSILTDPLYDNGSNFRFENYNKKNFLTGFEFLCGLVAAELPFHDWFFKYNPTTHNMSVINTSENNIASVFADTSLVTPVPAISCPIQDGKWTHSGTVQTTVYDNSGNDRNATISNITTGGAWQDDNTLFSNGLTSGNIQVDFPSITAINTLTEFTISFWFNPDDELIPSVTKTLVAKGVNVAQSIWIIRDSDVNNVRFVLFNTSSSDWIAATAPNAFPEANKWYLITCRWKSGEVVKISIDDNPNTVSGSTFTMTLTNAGTNLQLFRSTNGGKGRISLFRFYTSQISDTIRDELYYEGYHNPLFPKSENIQPVQEEDPDPIFIPFSNVYTLDKMTTPALADYRRINSLAGDSPLFERYNVADGTDTTDPELNPYNIADGVSTGGGEIPFSRIGSAPATIDSSDNSSGKVGDNENDAFALQLFSTSSGIGQTINGKIITKAIFWMRRPSSSVTGTLYCRIWNSGSSLTPVATLGSMPASSVNQGSSSDDWVAYTFTNTANTVAMANGYRIGIEYQGDGEGDVIDIQRKSGPSDLSAYQTTYDNGDWDDDGNNSFSVKCDLYTGGTGSPATEPNSIMKFGNYNAVMESIGSGDTLLTKLVTKITLRLKKVGSPTGTATIALTTSTGTILETYGTLNVSTLTTTTADYTFQNLNVLTPVSSGHMIGILWTPSVSGEVHVLSNLGNTTGNSWNGTASFLRRRISSTWSNNTLYDNAGKIYTGGNDFDAFLRFSSTRTRITEKAVNTSSGLNNRKITKVVVRGKKTGTPSGIINCYIRDPSDNIKVTFSSVDINTVGTTYQDIVFENYVHNYLINSGTLDGDKISIEYSGAGTSNYLELNSNKDVLEGLNTIAQTYDNGNYVDQGQRDLAGKMYEGGEPDLNSRTRVAQSIEHQNSRLKGKKITRVKAFLIRTGTASGTCFCNIRNDNDDLIKTLDSIAVSGLNTTVSTPSEITFEDTTNNYPMNVGDKVSIEFSGGDSSNQVGVLVRSVTPNYDGSNSYIRKYDEFDWDDSETTYDLCAIMDEGGFDFYPDPSLIPDPTPTNIKDLLFCAGNNAKSGFLETFLMEFRIYTKDITLEQADNLYDNRYSISPVGHGEILCPFSLRAVTLDPV